jgi:hypothetical protein
MLGRVGIFELWEDRDHVEHDTPTIGDMREHGHSHKRLDWFLSKKAARKGMSTLEEKYLSQGWRHMSSRQNTEEKVFLLGFGNPGTIDLTLSVVEKI